jgi:hypothetical protein
MWIMLQDINWENDIYIYLQEVIQIIANTSFIMWNIIFIRRVAKTCPNWLVNKKNI